MKLQKDVYLPFQNLAEFISNIFLIFHTTYDETEIIGMGRNFDDYPGFQPKTTPAQTYATLRKYLKYRGLSLVDATPTYLVYTTLGKGYLRQPSLLSALSTSLII